MSAGVGGNLCVTVPLYSVASNDHWTDEFDTEEFDDLIANIAMPAQYLLPGLANVYGQVAKDVEPAIDFLGDGVNLILAEPGESQNAAVVNAVDSFSNLVKNSPTFQTMFQTMEEQSSTHYWWVKLLDPDCNICWVFPHGGL